MANEKLQEAWKVYNEVHTPEWQDWVIQGGYVSLLTWYTVRNWDKHGSIGKGMIGFLWFTKIKSTYEMYKAMNETHGTHETA